MAAKSSIAPDIIWNWVIETLATSEQTDVSTLIGLVKMAPSISSNQGKDAREAVSLRILESLFPQCDDEAVDTDEGQNGKISFDPSESCENVLHQILPEHSAKLDKEKWNVCSFLSHKRSSLPKCALKKLKEAILESSHPILTSLKERSKLEIPNASESKSPVIDANLDLQDKTPKDDSAILNPRKDKVKLHSNNENDKRVSIDSMENLEFVVKDNIFQPNGLDNEHEHEHESLSEEENSMEEQHRGQSQSQNQSPTDSLVNLCVKCNTGGELLECRSDTCTFHVHGRCLGFEVTFDENGDFFCPFCVYSRAISKYQEAKKKVEEARNYLHSFSTFIVEDNRKRPNGIFKEQSEFEKNEKTEGIVDDHSMKEGEGQKKVNEKVNGNVNVSKHVTNSKPQTSTPKRKSNEKEKEKEKGSQRAIESSCSRELRKRKAQVTPLVVRFSRRKVIPWTKSEEETLKEGVERYSSVNDKKIPWKEILDFGHNVFNRGRTSIDLKDKWRNICKSTK
ncbi:hypothetical protein LXL04_018422 [Taraxacum kok-saghyz]